jgi:hypothetical protein
LSTPPAAVGIAVGRTQLSAAMVSAGARVEWVHDAVLPIGFFTGKPTPGHVTAMAEGLKNICREVKQTYIPVHVALPDPLGYLAVFDLEERPKNEKTRRDLARWRFARELDVPEPSLNCITQDLGSEDGKPRLLGQAFDGAWLECVRQALHGAGVTPWSINQAVSYRFNRFYDQVTRERQGGAMVSLDPDAWSLVVWDNAGRPRFLRSRWRSRGAGEADASAYQGIAEEAERTVLSYVHGSPNRSVAQFYVAGARDEVMHLSAALDRRMHEKPGVLGVELAAAQGSAENADKGLVSLSLVAAQA